MQLSSPPKPFDAATHVERCFLEAFDRVWSTMIEDTATTELIQGFVTEVIGAWVPTQLFDPSTLAKMTDRVFQYDAIRDFLFRLTTQFLQRLIDDPNGRANYTQLIENLAFSLDMHAVLEPGPGRLSNNSLEPAGTSLIPDEVSKALPPYQLILDALKGNKWLVSLVLIMFHVPLPHPPESGKK